MFKRKWLSAFLVMSLIGSLPVTAFAFRSAVVPGLPEGVHFEMTAEENGLSILATVHCVNPTASPLHIKIVGGVLSIVNPNINAQVYPSPGSSYGESKVPEGAYDVPAHSSVVMAHMVLPMKSGLIRMPSDGLVQPLAVMSPSHWIVRGKFDIIPNHYSLPMQPLDGNTIEAKMVADSEKEVVTLEEPEVHCMAYPVCYETSPMRIVVEDTVRMDLRWKRLDTILDNVKTVGSNVVSTNATVHDLEAQIKSTKKLAVSVNANPRPTR